MNLRQKIVLAIAGVMLVVSVMLALAVAADLGAERVRARQALSRAAARQIAATLATVPPAERAGFLGAHGWKFLDPDAVEALAVLDGSKVVVWASSPDPLPEGSVAGDTKGYDASRELPGDPAGGPWTVLVRSPPASISFSGGIAGALATLAAGTAILIVVAYGLLDRLVIRPVENLAAASRSIGANPEAAKVPELKRDDEVGELIRAYNRMVAEVADLRRNLEAKVKEATARFEKSQRGLMVAERLAATGRLAAGVAHEINNPLGGMMNAARTVRQRANLSPRDAEYLDLIVQGLDRIQHIVRSLLQFSRPVLSNVGPVSMAEAIGEAAAFCRHRIESEGANLRVEIPPDLPPVLGAKAELSQIVLNLLTNALDAVRDRPVREIKIGLRVAGGDSPLVEVAVSDTGCGMTEEQLRHAGELFYTTKGPDKGSGLGLAIVRHLVESHGGRLEIESRHGEGTRVTFRIPVAETNA
ncbi:MAG: HAMP domain-containing histidine kinase [Planctomycetota bacterium]|nr:HAMP domain-containing histidine kinase [Planctomycetota bacterium]